MEYKYKNYYRLRRNLWYILSEKNNFDIETVETDVEIEIPLEIEKIPKSADLGLNWLIQRKNTSQEKGEFLENAVVELFRQFS